MVTTTVAPAAFEDAADLSLDCLAGAACSRFFYRYDDRPRLCKNARPRGPLRERARAMCTGLSYFWRQTPWSVKHREHQRSRNHSVGYRSASPQMRSGAPLVMNRGLSASSMPVRTVWLASRSAAISGEKDHGPHAPRQHGGRSPGVLTCHHRPAISNRSATRERQEPLPSAIPAGGFGSTQED